MGLIYKIIMCLIPLYVYTNFIKWKTTKDVINNVKPDTIYITKIDTVKVRYYVMDSLVFKHNGKKVTKVYHGGK